MLENEPVGGERTGSEPAAETADSSRTPTRRARVTRRRTTSAAEAATSAGGVEDGAAGPTGSGTTPAGAGVDDAGAEAPVKVTRRRRKVTAAGEPAAGGEATGTPAADPVTAAQPGTTAEPAAAAEPAAPVKVTRTRRRKTAAVAEPADVTSAKSGAAASAATVSPGAVAQAGPTAGTAEHSAATSGTSGVPSGTSGAPGETTTTLFGSAGASGQTAAPAAGSGEPTTDQPEQPEPTRTRRRRSTPLSAPTVLFMPPDPGAVSSPPARPEPADEPVASAVEDAEPGETGRRRRRGRRTQEIAEPVVEPAAESTTAAAAEDDDESAEDDDEFDAAGARRRRRGRRGRGRGKGAGDDADETEEPAVAEGDGDEGDDSDEPLTRRRRRRRRKGSGDDGATAEDGVPTVVRIREPRRVADEVQGVTGSTRLEAKRQRRRDGRDQRRTRPPILSESEFLARREAVDRVMVVRQRGERTQIAVLEDGVLVEHYVTRASTGTMAGNVYLGKVQNVLPSMEAAFVDVGRGRNAVLYAGEVNWDVTGLEGRARSIEQALKSGDSVLVQVTKDPIGHKGARLTSHIALSGRHLVYVPNGNASGISRKLPDNERKRLRDILKKLVPDGAGVIVRTAAEGASEDDLARDVKRLQAQWEDIQDKATAGGSPALLYEEPDLVIRVVRDLFNEDFRELMVQGDDAYSEVEGYLSHVSPDLVARLRRYTGVVDVFAERRIDEQILKGLDRKVFLPSGGHLVIDRTEAMTVVDVNTGKYTGAGGNLEETVTRNNLEAAEEIVRQLRLRDLGGIVVIDFIDMVLESNRELVLRRLTECLGRDRTKHQVTEITSLGLVQMTRKRIGAGLLEAFSETCETCKGRGLIMHTEPVTDRSRQGAADKVKAVASAASGTAAGSGTTGTKAERRRARKAATEVPLVEDLVEDVAVAADDTMGYDLSRYADDPVEDVIPIDEDVIPIDEDVTPIDEDDAVVGAGVGRAGPLDPDAVDFAGPGELADTRDGVDPDEDDDEDGSAGLVSSGRRRARRSGTRRRTRP